MTTTAARRRGLRATLVDVTAVTGTTIVLLVITLRLWEGDLRIPFVYDDVNRPPLAYAPDAPYYVMVVKGLLQHGSYLVNHSLGFPFGQDLADYPETTEGLQFLMLRVLGWVLRDAVLTVNVYFLLTFVFVALTSWFVLRRLGVSRPVAVVVAVLYSFLPYHFARGTANLLLSGYFMVPIAVLLLLWVVSDRPPFIAGDATKWRVSFRGKSAIAVLVACAALASTGPYYALFTLVLLVLGVGVTLLARRDWRMVVSGGIVVVATLLVFGLNLMPSLVYWAQNGRNDVVGKRGVSETEVNGMKVSQLLLPVDEHRIGPLADLQEKSVEFTVVPSERGQQLGVIGALGFVGLLAFTLAALVRRRNDRDEQPERAPPTRFGTTPEILVRSGVYTVLAIVCGTVSGFSLLFSGVGLSQIRSWNRLSIFIGFFALLAVAFALDWLLPRLPRWHGRAVLAGVACVALLAVGVFDQTTSADVPEYDRIERAWKSDEQFLGSIERELGLGAAVFQLPYVYFPEAGFYCGTGPYDQVRGYVHADQLQWSWGGIRGRETEWQEQVVRLEPRETLDALAAVGFSGVLIDRAGYPDRAQLLEDGYAEVLGEQPQVSPNRRLSFFDLRPYARELRAELGPAGTEALREQTLAARPEGVSDRPCPANVTGREPPPG